MHAEILKGFFLGQVTATDLSRDLDAIWEPAGSQSRRFVFQDLLDDFEVHPEHLVRVCDAVLAGDITPSKLEGVGAALFTSDHFTWAEEGAEAERVAQTVSDWVDPEINFDQIFKLLRSFGIVFLQENTSLHRQTGGCRCTGLPNKRMQLTGASGLRNEDCVQLRSRRS